MLRFRAIAGHVSQGAHHRERQQQPFEDDAVAHLETPRAAQDAACLMQLAGSEEVSANLLEPSVQHYAIGLDLLAMLVEEASVTFQLR